MGSEKLLEFASPLLGIALVVIFATLADPKIGLALIIFSVILSPELNIGRAYLRAEDVLLVVGTLAWLSLAALMGRKIRPLKLNAAIFAFILWNILSFGNQLVFGNISPVTHTPQSILYSSLTLLKKLEYFFIFFLTANVLSSKRHIRVFLGIMAISLVVVDLYAIYDSVTHGYSVAGEVYRVSAPFDPEPNTFGQYLMMHILVMLSLYPVFPLAQKLAILLFLLPLTLFSFLYTYSRGGYFGLLISSFLIGLFKDKKVLAGWMVLVLLSAAIFPQSVIDRVQSGIKEIEEWAQGKADPTENAFASRVDSFREGFGIAFRNPIFGAGLGLVPLSRTEAQIPREAQETGIIGLLLFFWVLWEVFQLGFRLVRESRDPLFRSLGWGLLFALCGYMLSGFSAIPFTTIRTAFPFWLYTGMVASASLLEGQKKTYIRFAPFREQKEKVYSVS